MALSPSSPEELAAQLADANAKHQSITLCGAGTKNRMAGPICASDVTITTCALNRVLQYEPRDLTISVQAGLLWREFSRILAEHNQMVPLDPAFSDDATVGGIVAANSSGPRRRLYGTARDMVIGMTFATLEGKLVRTGGMVVKNVAGLDMGKLLIGSFGTLAAMAVVNFRLHPRPAGTRTYVQEFVRIAEAVAARDKILKSALQPAAIDILKTSEGYDLLVQAGGSPRVLDRYSRELGAARIVEDAEEQLLWRNIREFTPDFLSEHGNGAVLRASCTLSEVGAVLESLPAPALSRAGSGVCYGYFPDPRELRPPRRGNSVVEFAPADFRDCADLWPEPGSDFAMMKKVKQMFDPLGLLNRRRLYGRI
ncbi:MAG TPA: FAD-binding oxidoreductase [Bryobacteraceae bacterium]|nr:FAD-binding oxidoreductase [Bryobacteraceae bacterium]